MAEHHINKDIIFIAEDDVGLLTLISKRLGRLHYNVEGFCNGEKLIQRLRQKIPSLLLLDYQLSDMTAKELLKRLKTEELLSPFVIMTGHGNETLAVEMMKLGANDYLVKDSSFMELLPSVVKQSMKHFAVEKQLAKTQNEKEKLEIKLRQALKMEAIGTLAGGIAHDFNNILFPIVGHTEMLLDDLAADSKHRDSLNKIYEGALRARDLVQQILTFSRQDSCELELINPKHIVTEALNLIRSTIPTTIRIDQQIKDDCGFIKADPTQIHQVVINLATNAFHAMEDSSGVLKVTLDEVRLGEDEIFNPEMQPGLYVHLIVADTGVGMERSLREKIFEPFFSTKEKGKGTGMGLSVVHGIVKSMNGTVQVYSQLEKGSKFHVYLPVVKRFIAEKHSIEKEEILTGTEHILLVDDDTAIVEMEERMLNRLGYKVTAYSSSLEAFEAFQAAPDKFDLIITDMAMPELSGDKLSSQIIDIRPGIPILLCTGFSENMSEERAASIGIKGLLMKPVVRRDLAVKIRELLVPFSRLTPRLPGLDRD